jgi:proline iminopeptidase
MVCPVNQAFELAERLPQADVVICNHAGHSAMEAEITRQLVATTDAFIKMLEAS